MPSTGGGSREIPQVVELLIHKTRRAGIAMAYVLNNPMGAVDALGLLLPCIRYDGCGGQGVDIAVVNMLQAQDSFGAI